MTPESALAHLGSDVHPKGFQQFEAIGYQSGDDGKPHTADDVELGPVDVAWSVEEFLASTGTTIKISWDAESDGPRSRLPSDGPNPKRKFSRNNYGDIWVVATAKTEKEQRGKPMIGKSYLVVMVPTYIKWDQPEVE